MYLSENAKNIINDFRNSECGYLVESKCKICDSMSVINSMEMYASDQQKEDLNKALSALADYNALITELSKK